MKKYNLNMIIIVFVFLAETHHIIIEWKIT
jgi:hypothetical protein